MGQLVTESEFIVWLRWIIFRLLANTITEFLVLQSSWSTFNS